MQRVPLWFGLDQTVCPTLLYQLWYPTAKGLANLDSHENTCMKSFQRSQSTLMKLSARGTKVLVMLKRDLANVRIVDWLPLVCNGEFKGEAAASMNSQSSKTRMAPFVHEVNAIFLPACGVGKHAPVIHIGGPSAYECLLQSKHGDQNGTPVVGGQSFQLKSKKFRTVDTEAYLFPVENWSTRGKGQSVAPHGSCVHKRLPWPKRQVLNVRLEKSIRACIILLEWCDGEPYESLCRRLGLAKIAERERQRKEAVFTILLKYGNQTACEAMLVKRSSLLYLDLDDLELTLRLQLQDFFLLSR